LLIMEYGGDEWQKNCGDVGSPLCPIRLATNAG
jgi:hypothetical protein